MRFNNVAYSVDWINKVVTIPRADLAFVSSGNYRLDSSDFRAEIQRLQWEFSEGLWADQILDRVDPVTLSGVLYDGFDIIQNGYRFEFEYVSPGYLVAFQGSNTNLGDNWIPNGVSLIVNNSAGKTLDSAAGGISEQDKDDIAQRSATQVWDEPL